MKTTLTSDRGAISISFRHYSPNNSLLSTMNDNEIRGYLKKRFGITEDRKITFKEILNIRKNGTYRLFDKHPFTECELTYANSYKNIEQQVFIGKGRVYVHIMNLTPEEGGPLKIITKDNYNKKIGRNKSLDDALNQFTNFLFKILVDPIRESTLPGELKEDDIKKNIDKIKEIINEIRQFYKDYLIKSREKNKEKSEANKLTPNDIIEIKNKTFDIETLSPEDNKMLITVVDVKATDGQQNQEKSEPVMHRN